MCWSHSFPLKRSARTSLFVMVQCVRERARKYNKDVESDSTDTLKVTCERCELDSVYSVKRPTHVSNFDFTRPTDPILS